MNRLRAVRLLLPTLAPAVVMEDAPFEAVLPLMTMAPTGSPETHPGTPLTGTSPVKK
ncbi:MAG: hypothetical protein WDM87_09740 [Terracidiphilus sp.]